MLNLFYFHSQNVRNVHKRMNDHANNDIALQKAVAVSSLLAVWRAQKRLSDRPGMRKHTGLCSWHILSAALVVLQGRSGLLALVGMLCWGEGTWASHPSLARSCRGQDSTHLLPELLPVSCSRSLFPFSMSPSQTPVPTFLSQELLHFGKRSRATLPAE